MLQGIFVKTIKKAAEGINMSNIGDEKKEESILDIANRVNKNAEEGKKRDKKHYSFAG